MKNVILFIVLILTLSSCANYRAFDDEPVKSTSKSDSNIEYSGSAVFQIGD